MKYRKWDSKTKAKIVLDGRVFKIPIFKTQNIPFNSWNKKKRLSFEDWNVDIVSDVSDFEFNHNDVSSEYWFIKKHTNTCHHVDLFQTGSGSWERNFYRVIVFMF